MSTTRNGFIRRVSLVREPFVDLTTLARQQEPEGRVEVDEQG